MDNKKIIIKNSGYLYIRMFVLMLIGFYTTRVILEALGVEDLGIYNVVGSLMVMFDFVSSGLTNSVQRFLNVGLGLKDEKMTNQVFSQSLILNICFALIIGLIAEITGLWFINYKMIISPDRIYAAEFVLHFSVLSLLFRFVKIGYEGDLVARENMSLFAYLSIFEGVSKLIICFMIMCVEHFDKLILYSLLILVVNIMVTIINILYCKRYKESHFRLYQDISIYKKLLSFIGINSFGVISWALGKQGINVLLNMFFGPAINGAKALATTADSIIAKFSTNIDLAVRPQITKMCAQGRSEEMLNLTFKSTKYQMYLLIFLSLPFLLDTETILGLWLKDVPPYTSIFFQLMIFETMCNTLGSSFNTISMALGKIKNIQIYGRLITLCTLPISYLVLLYFKNPIIPVIIMILTTLAYSIFIAYDVNKRIHFGVVMYIKRLIIPLLLIVIAIGFVCLIFNMIISITNEYLMLLMHIMVLCPLSLALIYIIGVENKDKKSICRFIKRKQKLL